MPTARDFITMAMREAGVLGVGQSLLAQDVNDGFTLLNRMLSQWQKKRWIVPSLYEVSAIGNNQKSNLIGPGQYYNAPRPDKIQTAYFVQLTNDGTTPVSFPLKQIWSYEDYALVSLKELNSWPLYFFYDGAYPYGNVRIWPIPSSDYEIHLICKGPIGFNTQLEEGRITAGGVGYQDGAYPDIPFTAISGLGAGGTADVIIAGGVVTDVVVHTPGDGYKINDNLTLDTTLIGGIGAGFIWNVTRVTDSLDAEFNMPEEYQEAIHYNLCIRLCSMYQYPVNTIQAALAKLSLNTIKVSNAQIPTLKMPSSLRFSKNNSFYIFNADAQ